MNLFEFQNKAIKSLTDNPKLSILRADMGLGKTAIATKVADAIGEPTVFVCPAGIKYDIEAKIAEWTNRPIKHFCDHPTLFAGFLILPYTELEQFVPIHSGYTLIFDECQYLKNEKSIRTKQGTRLSLDAGRLLGMTGTLMLSRSSDMYSLGCIFIPRFKGIFKSFMTFAFRYCAPQKINIGARKVWSFSGASNTAELGRIFKPHVYDIKKEDVLRELPPKRYEYIYLTPNTFAKRAENQVEKLNISSLEHSKKFKEHVATYRKRIGQAKVKLAVEHIRRILQDEDKVVVFSYHQNVTQQIYKAFKERAVLVTGGHTAAQRKASVDKFQDGDARVFVGQILAAGVGITLTAARICVFVEYDWTPGNNAQAADRIHRIGQDRQCIIQYLTIKGSIDNTIFKSVTGKESVIDTFMSSVNEKRSHHATLAPSSASRWFACPGSVIATQGIPQTTHPAAVEGTRAHQYAEDFLTGKIEWKEIPPFFADDIKPYTDYIKKLRDRCTVCVIEDKLKTKHAPFKDVYGTADAVVVSGDTLHVVDLKFGKGIYVPIKNNKQLLIYGWLAYLKHVHKKNPKIINVRLTIVQPRVKVTEAVRSWDISLKELFEFARELQTAIKRTKLQEVAYKKGDHCFFCLAKPDCKTYMEVK